MHSKVIKKVRKLSNLLKQSWRIFQKKGDRQKKWYNKIQDFIILSVHFVSKFVTINVVYLLHQIQVTLSWVVPSTIMVMDAALSAIVKLQHIITWIIQLRKFYKILKSTRHYKRIWITFNRVHLISINLSLIFRLNTIKPRL